VFHLTHPQVAVAAMVSHWQPLEGGSIWESNAIGGKIPEGSLLFTKTIVSSKAPLLY
jgi:hypothetical protein